MLFIIHNYYNFTEEEFNSAKGNDLLSCTCSFCKKEMFKKKNLLVRNRNNNTMFCSTECSNKYRAKGNVKVLCSNCGAELQIPTNSYNKSKTKNFFCNHSCAASYTNKYRLVSEEQKKKVSETHKNIFKEKTGFSSRKEKLKSEHICKICGNNSCSRPEICKSKIFCDTTNIEKLGFDISTIGTENVYSEYDRIQKYLFHLYHIKLMSYTDIMKLHNIKCLYSMTKLFRNFNIEARTISDSVILSILQGKYTPPIDTSKRFKHGWHTSWENKQFYFRSSYEEDYMKELDEKKISYDGEIFRIAYFDTQKQRLRVAIPDIYLPDTKTIVEIKSDYTYDKQEMIDKSNEYKRLGFNFKLVLEHIEYDYCV